MLLIWVVCFVDASLKDINLSYFNTNNVTNMRCMFNGCSSLTNINLSYFNIIKLIIWVGCSKDVPL